MKIPGKKIQSLVAIILLAFFVFLIAVPFIYMLSGSFKNDAEMFRNPARILPAEPTVRNFVQLFHRLDFIRLLLNSMFVSSVTACGAMLLCAIVAYGFVRFRFRGRDVLFFLVLVTMMVPPYTLLIPQFKLFSRLGWVNTYLPLMVPFLMSAFGIFLIRSVMVGIPNSIFENASIDGCSELRICLQFALPLSRTGILIYGVILFMMIWNDFLTPIIYLTDETLFTVTIGLSTLVGFYDTEYGVPMAGALLSAIPVILILNLVGQKHFVTGMMAGSVKG